jgi:hypothetical protein
LEAEIANGLGEGPSHIELKTFRSSYVLGHAEPTTCTKLAKDLAKRTREVSWTVTDPATGSGMHTTYSENCQAWHFRKRTVRGSPYDRHVRFETVQEREILATDPGCTLGEYI